MARDVRVPRSGLPRCCCLFSLMPIVALIKVLILIGPVTLMHCLGMTLIYIIILPKNFFYCYLTLFQASYARVSLVARIIGCIITPVFLFVMLAVVALFSCLFGLSLGLLFPVFATFREEKRLFSSGVLQTLEMSVEHVKQYWEFNTVHWFSKLAAIRDEQPTTEPCRFPHVGYLLVGLVVSFLGFLVAGVACALLWAFKLPALIVRGFIHLATNRRLYGCHTRAFQEKWWTLPLFVLGFVLMPIIVTLVAVGGMLFCFGVGLYAGVIAYRARSFVAGVRFIGFVVWKTDSQQNSFVLNTSVAVTCVPCCLRGTDPDAARHGRPSTPKGAGAGAGVDISSGHDEEAGSPEAQGANMSFFAWFRALVQPKDGAQMASPASDPDITIASMVEVEGNGVNTADTPPDGTDAGAGTGAAGSDGGNSDSKAADTGDGANDANAGADADADANANADAGEGVDGAAEDDAGAAPGVGSDATEPTADDAVAGDTVEGATSPPATADTGGAGSAAGDAGSAAGEDDVDVSVDAEPQGDAGAGAGVGAAAPAADGDADGSGGDGADGGAGACTVSGEPLLPIVRPEEADEFTELQTDDGTVYWINFARNQTCMRDPNVPPSALAASPVGDDASAGEPQ